MHHADNLLSAVYTIFGAILRLEAERHFLSNRFGRTELGSDFGWLMMIRHTLLVF